MGWFKWLVCWFKDSAVWFGTLAQWVSGLGTLAAVAVALFKDPFFRWRNRPVLNATLAPRGPDCTKAVMSFFDNSGNLIKQQKCYYWRLKVTNAGKGRAEQVQVYAAALDKQGADRLFSPVDTFLPMNLTWAHSRSSPPDVFAAGISSQLGRHCDLGFVGQPAPGAECSMALTVEAPPATDNNILHPGVYRLHLLIAAANASTIACTATINVTGKWFDDPQTMFRDGLAVSVSVD